MDYVTQSHYRSVVDFVTPTLVHECVAVVAVDIFMSDLIEV